MTVPSQVDGANVIAFATLPRETASAGTEHQVFGETVSLSGLLLGQYNGSSQIYLFYCDEHWNVITDTLHDSVDEAVEQARFEFGDIAFAAPSAADPSKPAD